MTTRMKRPYTTTTEQAPKRRKAYHKRGSTYVPRSFTQNEWKYLDTTVSTACNQTGSYTLLNGLAPGNSASQRIGQKILIKSIELRFVANVDLVGGVAQTNRWLLLQDSQCNGAAPAALTDFLAPGTVNGLRALTNRKRFTNLKDKTYELTPVDTDYARRNFHYYMKLAKNIVTEYNAGTAGTIADIATNSLYLVCLGSEVVGNTDGALNGVVRIRYTDM